MSKLRRFDLLRIAHLEVSEDLPQQEGILRNLPNNLEAGIPTIPNKDPWSCEEYTLNLNHSTWGYLKYNSFTRKKSQKKDGQNVPSRHQVQLFCGIFWLANFSAQNKKHHRRRSSSFSKCETLTIRLRHGSQRCLYTAIHRDRASPWETERGIPLVMNQVSWEFKVPPPPPPRNKPLIRPY